MKQEILDFFKNIFSITEFLVDIFVNYDNTTSAFTVLTELIEWYDDFTMQFRNLADPSPQEHHLIIQGAELLKVVAKQILNVSENIQTPVESADLTPIAESMLYKSARGRAPSHLNFDDIQNSIMSPYGQKAIKDALAVVKEKGVKKFIATLLAQQVIHRTAEDIVKYLFLYLNQFDETDLGDYLGSDGGTTDEEQTLMKQVRYRFTRENARDVRCRRHQLEGTGLRRGDSTIHHAAWIQVSRTPRNEV